MSLAFWIMAITRGAMKTDLDHLPESKRCELEFVVEVIRQGFAVSLSNRMAERLRAGKLLKIILFGSYARGDWVVDPIGRYFSDFDLLVVVNHEDLTDVSEFWSKTEDRLVEEVSAGTKLRTPVSVIYHSLDEVNEKLELGRYFFMDIVREGIVLFEEPGHSFAEPRPLSPEEALRETLGLFRRVVRQRRRVPRRFPREPCQGAAEKSGLRATPGNRALLSLRLPGPHALQSKNA